MTMDDITCPQCKAMNQPDADSCNDCDSSLLVGKLTSLGMGVLPKGFVWEMRPGDLSLGRNIANDFVIPSNLIAGEQLQFVYHGKGFSLLDVEHKSRCTVGGRTVSDKTKLRDGVTIKVGVEEFLFNWSGDEAREVTRVDPFANHLQLMLGVVSEFHTSLNLQEVFNNAVDAVVRLTHTKRGYAFLVDVSPDGEMELREVAARRAGGKALTDDDPSGYTISQSIISQVVSGDEPIVIEDAGAQQVRTDTMRKFKLISVVCLPLVTFNHRTGKKRVMGVIYCDSPMPTGELPKHCRPTLQMLTQILTATIVKWQNYEKMESVFNAYEHTVAALEQELAGLQKDIETLQARVSEADGTNTIGPDEIQSELQTVNARVSSAVDSLNRLRETQ